MQAGDRVHWLLVCDMPWSSPRCSGCVRDWGEGEGNAWVMVGACSSVCSLLGQAWLLTLTPAEQCLHLPGLPSWP